MQIHRITLTPMRHARAEKPTRRHTLHQKVYGTFALSPPDTPPDCAMSHALKPVYVFLGMHADAYDSQVQRMN
jgi:hypothetical protein